MRAGGETLVVLGSGRVAALVDRTVDLGPILAELRDLVDVRLIMGGLSQASRSAP